MAYARLLPGPVLAARRALRDSCYPNLAVSDCAFCAFFSPFAARSQALGTRAAALPGGKPRTVILATGVLVGSKAGADNSGLAEGFVSVLRQDRARGIGQRQGAPQRIGQEVPRSHGVGCV